MKKQHFHIAYSLSLFKKYILLVLLPLLRAVLSFDPSALYAALQQTGLLALALVGICLLLWYNTFWEFRDGCFTWQRGVFFRQNNSVSADMLACVAVRRTPLLRVLAGAQLLLYYRNGRRTAKLYLPKGTALALADSLLPTPTPDKRIEYHPSGLERLTLAVVSCDVLASLTLGLFSYYQARDLLDEATLAQARAQMQSLEESVLALVTRWVPVGLASLLLVVALVWGLVLLTSLLRTALYHVYGDGQVLVSDAGLLTHVHTVILLSSVTCCDISAGLLARLTRCYPVYLCAGSYTERSTPWFIYRPGRDQTLASLVPGSWVTPAVRLTLAQRKNRSLPAYLALPGGVTALVLVFWLEARWMLPALALPLGMLGLLCLLWCFVALEGFFTEGVRFPTQGIVVHYTRRLTHHTALVLSTLADCRLSQTPFHTPVGRCNAVIQLPGNLRLRARSVVLEEFLRGWQARAEK